MKTCYILIWLLSIFVNNLNAQWINSITVSPANPKTTDTIYVYADCSFPSGSCDEHTQFVFVNGNVITASATHCLGMLAVICDATDTFQINPLPAGTYSFVFNVNAGALPSPCTPGIVPGPTDSISFTVTNVTGMPVIVGDLFQFSLFPNPANDRLQLVCSDASLINENNFLIIYSITGQELFKTKINGEEMLIDVSQFSKGTYLCRIAGQSVNEKHWIEIVE